jgi:hypothetical protein
MAENPSSPERKPADKQTSKPGTFRIALLIIAPIIACFVFVLGLYAWKTADEKLAYMIAGSLGTILAEVVAYYFVQAVQQYLNNRSRP